MKKTKNNECDLQISLRDNKAKENSCHHTHKYYAWPAHEWYCPDGCGYFERQE